MCPDELCIALQSTIYYSHSNSDGTMDGFIGARICRSLCRSCGTDTDIDTSKKSVGCSRSTLSCRWQCSGSSLFGICLSKSISILELSGRFAFGKIFASLNSLTSKQADKNGMWQWRSVTTVMHRLLPDCVLRLLPRQQGQSLFLSHSITLKHIQPFTFTCPRSTTRTKQQLFFWFVCVQAIVVC